MSTTAGNVQIGVQLNNASLNKALAQVSSAINNIQNQKITLSLNSNSFSQPLGRIKASTNEFTKSLEAANARVIAFGASAGAIFAVQSAFTNLLTSAVQVEKTLADINVILGQSAEGLSHFSDGLFDVARGTAQSFGEVGKAATELARQGLSAEETLKRTRDALILTRLSGLDAASSVEVVTAALNTFNQVGLDSTVLINKLATVDASFAVSSADLAESLKRVGSTAKDVGVSLDELLAVVAATQQTTARGGAVIGNSLKSIFTRVQRSDVLDQLEGLGVAVRDLGGDALPAMIILQNLAGAFNGLSKAQQAQIGESVAGIYQINQLRAILGDLSKGHSVYAQALSVSSQASNTATKRNEELNKTFDAQYKTLVANATQASKKIGELVFAPSAKNLLGIGNRFLEDLGKSDTETTGGKIAQGILGGLGKFLAGPGMALAFGLIGKLALNLGKFASESGAQFLGLNTRALQQKQLQQDIQSLLQRHPDFILQAAQSTGGLITVQQHLLKLLREESAIRAKTPVIAQQLAQNMLQSGTRVTRHQQVLARGLVPNESAEVMGALSGGYNPGQVKQMSIPGMGRVTYNTAETIKQFPGMRQPAIMPPRESEAGKNYGKSFQEAHGFNPYAAAGHTPETSRAFVPSKVTLRGEGVHDGDSLAVNFTPASEPVAISSRLIGADAYELRDPHKRRKDSSLTAAYEGRNLLIDYVTRKFGNIKEGTDVTDLFRAAGLNKKEKYGRPFFRADDFAQDLINRKLGVRYWGEGKRASENKRNASAGFIPNFNAEASLNKKIDPSKLTRWDKIRHFNPEFAVFRKPYLKPDGTGVGPIEIGKDPMAWGSAYETFLKNGGLESIGFSNVKHILGGAPIDFLAKYKTGDPYALDAKIGYGDADSSRVQAKLDTMMPFIRGQSFQGRLFKNEFLGHGFKEEELDRLKTGIVFGNASDKDTGHKQIYRAVMAGVPVGGVSAHTTISRGLVPNFKRAFAKTGEALMPGPAKDDKGNLSPVFKKIYSDQAKEKITFLDFDGTLVHTRGDAEYAKASNPKERRKVLQDFFTNPGRINDIKSSRLTPFGSDLKARVDANRIRPDLLGIMTASDRTAGMPEYINQTWKIPIDEIHQRYKDKTGTKASKVAELRAAGKAGKGPAIGRLVDDLAMARGFVPNFLSSKEYAARFYSNDPRIVLGVGPNATMEQIKTAYRKEINENHPDKSRPENKILATEYAKMINGAYAKLKGGSPNTGGNVFTQAGGEMASVDREIKKKAARDEIINKYMFNNNNSVKGLVDLREYSFDATFGKDYLRSVISIASKTGLSAARSSRGYAGLSARIGKENEPSLDNFIQKFLETHPDFNKMFNGGFVPNFAPDIHSKELFSPSSNGRGSETHRLPFLGKSFGRLMGLVKRFNENPLFTGTVQYQKGAGLVGSLKPRSLSHFKDFLEREDPGLRKTIGLAEGLIPNFDLPAIVSHAPAGEKKKGTKKETIGIDTAQGRLKYIEEDTRLVLQNNSSAEKGGGFAQFQELARISREKGKPIYSKFITSQNDRLGSAEKRDTNFNALRTLYPQLDHRMIPGFQTSLLYTLSGPPARRLKLPFRSLSEMKNRVNDSSLTRESFNKDLKYNNMSMEYLYTRSAKDGQGDAALRNASKGLVPNFNSDSGIGQTLKSLGAAGIKALLGAYLVDDSLNQIEIDDLIKRAKVDGKLIANFVEKMPNERSGKRAFRNAWKKSPDMQRAFPNFASSGFIPNFNALKDSIDREMAAGYSSSQIRVGKDPSLVAPWNPDGAAVFNSTEGSLKRALSMHRSSGKSTKDLQSQGASKGFVPNFFEVNTFDTTMIMGSITMLAMTMKGLASSTRKVTQEQLKEFGVLKQKTAIRAQVAERASILVNERVAATKQRRDALESVATGKVTDDQRRDYKDKANQIEMRKKAMDVEIGRTNSLERKDHLRKQQAVLEKERQDYLFASIKPPNEGSRSLQQGLAQNRVAVINKGELAVQTDQASRAVQSAQMRASTAESARVNLASAQVEAAKPQTKWWAKGGSLQEKGLAIGMIAQVGAEVASQIFQVGNEGGTEGRKKQAALSGVGTAVSMAATGAMIGGGLPGALIGGGLGIALAAVSYFQAGKKTTEDYSLAIELATRTQRKAVEGINGYAQSISTLNSLMSSGAGPIAIREQKMKIVESLSSITDPELRKKLVSLKGDPKELAELQTESKMKLEKDTKTKGLEQLLVAAIKPGQEREKSESDFIENIATLMSAKGVTSKDGWDNGKAIYEFLKAENPAAAEKLMDEERRDERAFGGIPKHPGFSMERPPTHFGKMIGRVRESVERKEQATKAEEMIENFEVNSIRTSHDLAQLSRDISRLIAFSQIKFESSAKISDMVKESRFKSPRTTEYERTSQEEKFQIQRVKEQGIFDEAKLTREFMGNQIGSLSEAVKSSGGLTGNNQTLLDAFLSASKEGKIPKLEDLTDKLGKNVAGAEMLRKAFGEYNSAVDQNSLKIEENTRALKLQYDLRRMEIKDAERFKLIQTGGLGSTEFTNALANTFSTNLSAVLGSNKELGEIGASQKRIAGLEALANMGFNLESQIIKEKDNRFRLEGERALNQITNKNVTKQILAPNTTLEQAQAIAQDAPTTNRELLIQIVDALKDPKIREKEQEKKDRIINEENELRKNIIESLNRISGPESKLTVSIVSLRDGINELSKAILTLNPTPTPASTPAPVSVNTRGATYVPVPSSRSSPGPTPADSRTNAPTVDPFPDWYSPASTVRPERDLWAGQEPVLDLSRTPKKKPFSFYENYKSQSDQRENTLNEALFNRSFDERLSVIPQSTEADLKGEALNERAAALKRSYLEAEATIRNAPGLIKEQNQIFKNSDVGPDRQAARSTIESLRKGKKQAETDMPKFEKEIAEVREAIKRNRREKPLESLERSIKTGQEDLQNARGPTGIKQAILTAKETRIQTEIRAQTAKNALHPGAIEEGKRTDLSALSASISSSAAEMLKMSDASHAASIAIGEAAAAYNQAGTAALKSAAALDPEAIRLSKATDLLTLGTSVNNSAAEMIKMSDASHAATIAIREASLAYNQAGTAALKSAAALDPEAINISQDTRRKMETDAVQRAEHAFKTGESNAEGVYQAEQSKILGEVRRGDTSVWEALGSDSMAKMRAESQNTKEKLLQNMIQIRDGMSDAFEKGFESFAFEGKKIKEVGRDIVLTLMRQLMKLSFDQGINKLFKKLTTGQIGVPDQMSEGGLVKGYASGGKVSGGSGRKDDVPAMLNSGEYVIRKASVNKYGENFLKKLNDGGIAKFAEGGSTVEDLNSSYTKKDLNVNVATQTDRWYGAGNMPSQSLRSTSSAGENRASFNLANTVAYNDPSRPGAARYFVDESLSGAALDDAINPQNAERATRAENFVQYQQYIQDEIESRHKQMEAFKDEKKQILTSAFINAAVAVGSAGLEKLAAAKDAAGALANPKLAAFVSSTSGQAMMGAASSAAIAAGAGASGKEVMLASAMGGATSGLGHYSSQKGEQANISKYINSSDPMDMEIGAVKLDAMGEHQKASEVRGVARERQGMKEMYGDNYKYITKNQPFKKGFVPSMTSSQDAKNYWTTQLFEKKKDWWKDVGQEKRNTWDAKNNRTKLALGGQITGQTGTDKVPAMLTAGEYVINKDSVDRYGLEYFNKLNKGFSPGATRFANGGFVGENTNPFSNVNTVNPSAISDEVSQSLMKLIDIAQSIQDTLEMTSAEKENDTVKSLPNDKNQASQDITNNVSITINVAKGQEPTAKTSSSSGGEDEQDPEKAEKTEKFARMMEAVSLKTIIEQQRPGGLLYD